MIPIMPVSRKWFVCPYCGQKLALIAENAVCIGVFVRCKKCRVEVEIKTE